jgi:hypothetical protein
MKNESSVQTRKFLMGCSSRREKAPNFGAVRGEDQLEPPYVCCYNLITFERR